MLLKEGDMTNTKYSYPQALRHYTEVKTETIKIIKSIVVDRLCSSKTPVSSLNSLNLNPFEGY